MRGARTPQEEADLAYHRAVEGVEVLLGEWSRLVLIAALKAGTRDQAQKLLERSADSRAEEPVAQWEGVFLSDATRARQSLTSSTTRFARPCSARLPLFEGPLHLALESHFRERGDG